ncbi:alkaline phosphatase family protein [Mycolicibacterium hodleri]|uniref:Phosphodiesterase n=1 Tax=Mycolicibacterium hodleri TaxID=49897 RepID=A0A502EDP6_9MYCO|nr:alkaline phosphatase family protein [Mycolicibacterium hodleri]TPG35129.1 phosphodiesterase [Mycolicibacterium hodleri]
MGLRRMGVATATICLCAAMAGCAGGSDGGSGATGGDDKHVVLVSVDGMHASDLAAFVSAHPQSALATLVGRGVNYTAAQTPVPSDSFPGLLAQVTGGHPRTTGVYYDDSYAHDLLEAGTTNCTGAKPGAAVSFTEELDKDTTKIDGGQGLANLPDGVLQMTKDPNQVIDPAKLPVNPATCAPLSPGDYLKVNTVFSVIHDAGRRTAWSDKHPAYAILNGAGGITIDDLFTPEVDSNPAGSKDGDSWTVDNSLTQRYDTYKVDAVVNEIGGKDHSGSEQVGMPALLGMNFQSVSTAEKLATSGGRPGGYGPEGRTPGPVLESALSFVDAQVGRMVEAIDKAGATNTTTVILSAKHGQAPIQPETLTRIDDGAIIDDVNANWSKDHPETKELIVHSVNDDAMIMWLADRSPQAAAFVKQQLAAHAGVGTDLAGKPRPFTASGTEQIYAGADAAAYFGTTATDPRVPDVYATTQPGTVYTSKTKIAEHGGAAPADRNVPLVVAGPGVSPRADGAEVSTAQIAPTILVRLGLDPRKLQAVVAEGTQALPGT